MQENGILLEELRKERKNIKTDSYDMSFGEVVSLYKDNDLKLDPAYQRLFRWKSEQKSKFIESILLGIPIPEIFVSQKEDGKWDIVDGVQRISTILELMGELVEEKTEKKRPQLVLEGTKYLPSLEGYTWDKLPDDMKRIIKRARVGVNIILTENSIKSQYELFQRLNTGGIVLEDQEVRNCLLIMLDSDFYEKINELKNYEPFKRCLGLNDDKIQQEYHMELIIRYLIGKINLVDYSQYNCSTEKLASFIDNEITNILDSKKMNIVEEIDIFKKTFDLLSKTLEKRTFKKYSVQEDKFSGSFSNASFEAILVGLAENIDFYNENNIVEKIKGIYSEERFLKAAGRGVKAITRFRDLNEFSREYFKHD